MSIGLRANGTFSGRLTTGATVVSGLVIELRLIYLGQGSCYIEMGRNDVGRVDVDFRGGPKPQADFTAPSVMTATEKMSFGATRRKRWFGSRSA